MIIGCSEKTRCNTAGIGVSLGRSRWADRAGQIGLKNNKALRKLSTESWWDRR